MAGSGVHARQGLVEKRAVRANSLGALSMGDAPFGLPKETLGYNVGGASVLLVGPNQIVNEC